MDDNALENTAIVTSQTGVVARWQQIPLYGRIIIGVILGLAAGLALGNQAAFLATPGKLVLRLLGALAPPLILVAIVHTFMTTHLGGPLAARLPRLLLMNTLVAITVGLTVANVIQPGRGAGLAPAEPAVETTHTANPLVAFIENVPKSLLGPLGDDGKVIGVIFVAVACLLTGGWLLIQRAARPDETPSPLPHGEVLSMRVLPWETSTATPAPRPSALQTREPAPPPVRPQRQPTAERPARQDPETGTLSTASALPAPVTAAEPAEPASSVPALQRFRFDPAKGTSHAAAAVTRAAQHPELTPTAKLERDVKASVKPSCLAPNATKNMPIQLGGVLNAPVLAAAIITEKCSW